MAIDTALTRPRTAVAAAKIGGVERQVSDLKAVARLRRALDQFSVRGGIDILFYIVRSRSKTRWRPMVSTQSLSKENSAGKLECIADVIAIGLVLQFTFRNDVRISIPPVNAHHLATSRIEKANLIDVGINRS